MNHPHHSSSSLEPELDELRNLLQKDLPETQKQAYSEALERCPALVETESDPRRYLRWKDGNAMLAAKAIIEYWELRKKIFQDRAFLPLDLSGEGAFTEADIRKIALGFFAVLPEDKEGRPVVFSDRNRLGQDVLSADTNALSRLIFFALHSASLNPNTQTKGFVVVSVAVSKKYFIGMALQDFIQTIPVKIARAHLLIRPPKGGKRFAEEMVVSAEKFRLSNTFPCIAEIHVVESIRDIQQKLALHGIGSGHDGLSGLPVSIGGTWTYEKDFLEQINAQGYVPSKWQHLNVAGIVSTADETQTDSDCRNDSDIPSFIQLKLPPTQKEMGISIKKDDAIDSHPVPYKDNSTIKSNSAVDERHKQALIERALDMFRRKKEALMNKSCPDSIDNDFDQKNPQNSVERTPTGELKEKHDDDYDDAYPTKDSDTSRFRETEEYCSQALVRFQEAIDSIPENEKTSYLEARERCPELFETECHPLLALRIENYDVWAAAKRVVAHWELRKELFGQDRAFRPMVQTGEGALSPDDINNLERQSLVRLPSDAQGRPVLFYDSTRIIANLQPQERYKLVFYHCTVLAENKMAQVEGIRALIVANMQLNNLINSANASHNRLFRCLFVKIHSVHFLYAPELCSAPERNYFLKSIFPQMVQILANFIGERFRAHLANSIDGLARQLEECEMSKDNFPERIGGNLSDKDLQQWNGANRAAIEKERYKHVLARYRETCTSLPTSVVPFTPELDDKRKRRRAEYLRRHALHSRKMRRIQKDQLKTLESTYYDMQKTNTELRAESQRLETLILQAHREVQRFNSKLLLSQYQQHSWFPPVDASRRWMP